MLMMKIYKNDEHDDEEEEDDDDDDDGGPSDGASLPFMTAGLNRKQTFSQGSNPPWSVLVGALCWAAGRLGRCFKCCAEWPRKATHAHRPRT